MSSIFEQIIIWQNDLPAWVSDLIRRILNKERIEPYLNEIYQNILVETNLTEGISTSQRLQKNDCQIDSNSSSKVFLKKIHSLKNINAIKDDESIDFAQDGMTLIYGENGAGKSGYARLLKTMCRSRDRLSEIYGNVYEPNKTECSAVFDFQCDGENNSVKWEKGVTTNCRLSEIAIFDSTCARIILNDKNEFEYVPYGADVFQSLCDCFNNIRKLNETFRKDIPQQPAELSKIANTTTFSKVLALLNKAKSPDDVVAEVKLTIEEENELHCLQKIVEPELLTKARQDLNKKTSSLERIIFVRNQIQKLQDQVSAEALKLLCSAWKTAKDARSAAIESAKGFENLKDLKGIGSETWKTLFLAAQSFSNEFVYPDTDFPSLVTGAKCVLCFQELTQDGTKRFIQFRDYINNSAETFAATKKQEFLSKLSLYKSSDLQDLKAYSDVVYIIAEKYPYWPATFDVFINEVETRRKQVHSHLQDGDFLSIPSSTIINLDEIDNIIESEKQEIQKYTDLLKEGSSQRNIERFSFLRARKIAQNCKEYFQTYINSLTHNKRIDDINSLLNTRKISIFASQLIGNIVTEDLRSRLQTEFNSLLATPLNVDLKQTMQQGKASHYLTLNISGNNKIAPKDILSEGEQKVVAIASFLAEISTFQHRSGIVFDDPVSSLDHKWKIRIADRLAKEAKIRQVIVFTHDISFVIELQRACNVSASNLILNSLTRAGKTAGIRETESPWPMLTVGKRIGYLKAEHQRLDKIYRTEGEGLYRREIARIYSLLRSSWERAIEEILFNEAVIRFRNSIETIRLKGVPIPDEDYTAIFKGMSKCSEFTDAHDEAAEKSSGYPLPNELLLDISDLEKYVSLCREKSDKC